MKTKSTLLIAAGLFLALGSQAQYQAYHDRNDIRHDKKDMYVDRRDIRQDEMVGNWSDLRHDRRDLREDRHDFYRDRRDLRYDRRHFYYRYGRKFCY